MVELTDRIRADHTAVIVVDVQNDFVHPDGKVAQGGADVAVFRPTVAAINRLIDGARRAGIQVIFARVEHGPRVDLAPYRAKYELRGMYETDTLCHEGSWGAQLTTELTPPTADEPVIIKHGYDAFQVPTLEPMLRGSGVETVVVCGVVTNLCVAATAHSAFERGFFVVLPNECSAGTDQASVEQSIRLLETYYGQTAPLDDVLGAWASTPAALANSPS